MSDDKMLRFQSALDKVLQKSMESNSDEATLSLSVTTLQAAVDNADSGKALEIFENCAEIYTSMEEPEGWIGKRLGQLSSQLQRLLKADGKIASDTEAFVEPAE